MTTQPFISTDMRPEPTVQNARRERICHIRMWPRPDDGFSVMYHATRPVVAPLTNEVLAVLCQHAQQIVELRRREREELARRQELARARFAAD